MLAHGVEREEELFRHAAADIRNQALGKRNRFRLYGHAFGEIRGDFFAVERDALPAEADRGADRIAAADDVTDAVVEMAADEILDLAGRSEVFELVERRAVRRKIAVESYALRRSAVALEGIAGEGGAGLSVDPDETVVVVPRRGDRAKAAFEELAFGKAPVGDDALEVRLGRRRIVRIAGADPDRDGHGVAERACGGVESRGLDSEPVVQCEMAADVVAVDVGVEQPVDVAGREAETGKRRDQEFFRLQVRRIHEEILVAPHEDDAGPYRTERNLQEKSPREDLFESRTLRAA